MADTDEHKRFLEYVNRINWDITEGYIMGAQVVALQNLLINNPEVKTVFEIGFNGGVSSAAFLAVRPDITVVSVDLGFHDYVLKAKTLIDRVYPGRHTLVIGDSTMAVPRLAGLLKAPFDFLFIDGGHLEPVPRLDIENCRALCKPEGSLVCIDDWCEAYGGAGVNQAIGDALAAGVLQSPVHRYTSEERGWGTFTMKAPVKKN
jgi:predicted O-methyltransferase YrrM